MSAVTSPASTRTTTIPFRAGDGRELNLLHVEGDRASTRGPVLLVHGAGVRAEIFRAPVGTTIVDALLAAGYDVWLENWRASIDLEPNPWTLDQAAVHDHPAAVQRVVAETGADTVQAIIHCQGSTSFAMSAVAGLLPHVTTIVANAVTLHPVVPAMSRFKIGALTPLVSRVTPYLDPRWTLDSPGLVAKATVAFVLATHHECDNTVCRMASFTYGTGFPCLWSHDTINDATHEWLKGEFAAVPVTFFRQMATCIARGHLVSVDGDARLPASSVAAAPRTDARWVLLAGTDNRCFLPESQERTFAFLDAHQPDHHALHLVPGYGHLDVFMGKDAARDVFPTILEELEP